MPTAIQAVVFDLDDTLYDERSYALSGLTAVAAAFADGFDAPFDLLARFRELFGSPDRGRIFNVVAQELGVLAPETLVAEMIQVFRNHPPTIALCADAVSVLDRFSGRYKLGLISDGYLVSQRSKLEALRIRERFDAIILTDEWGRRFWKPHPRAFEEIAARLDTDHRACAYVADNRVKDFVAPNALGWRTVCLRRPGGVYENEPAPKGGEPQTTIDTLDALEGALEAK